VLSVRRVLQFLADPVFSDDSLSKRGGLISLILMNLPKTIAVLAFVLALNLCCGLVGEDRPIGQMDKRVEFAIAGLIDLDDDGMSDVATLRSLIGEHNGKVVAYCAGDGTTQGKFTSSTSFLVVGTPPAFGSEARKAFVSFVSQAKAAGVELIPLSHIKRAVPGAFASKPAPSVFKFYTGRSKW